MDIAGVISTIVLIIFFFSVVTRQTLPELLLPIQKRNYKALKEPAGDPLRKSAPRPARRKTHRRPSEIPLNQDEGLRAAFYTERSRPATRRSKRISTRSICSFPTGCT